MVTQADVDELQIELEQLRVAMMRDREMVRQRMSEVIEHARVMRDDAAGGKFEPAICSVHDLLLCLNRGLNAQANLLRTRSA